MWTRLSLLEAGRKGKGTLSHLGLQVATTDDVVTIRNRWEAAGLEPEASCCSDGSIRCASASAEDVVNIIQI